MKPKDNYMDKIKIHIDGDLDGKALLDTRSMLLLINKLNDVIDRINEYERQKS